MSLDLTTHVDEWRPCTHILKHIVEMLEGRPHKQQSILSISPCANLTAFMRHILLKQILSEHSKTVHLIESCCPCNNDVEQRGEKCFCRWGVEINKCWITLSFFARLDFDSRQGIQGRTYQETGRERDRVGV